MRTEDIVEKVFTRAFMGYDIEQVDVFLDEIIEALERYEAEKQEMLTAMEYLMKKLERGQTMPLADMKKAIDSGRTQAEKPSSKTAAQEPKNAARSIARGTGSAKSMRAPKISRVKADQDAKDEIIRKAQAEQPQVPPEQAQQRAKRVAAAAESWLDELLINISEHETSDAKAEQPQAAQGTADKTETQESIAPQPEEGKPEQ